MCVLHKLKPMLQWLPQTEITARCERDGNSGILHFTQLNSTQLCGSLSDAICSHSIPVDSIFYVKSPLFFAFLLFTFSSMFCIEFGFKILFIAVVAGAVAAAAAATATATAAAVASHIRQFFAASGCHLDYVVVPVVVVVVAVLIIITAP